MFPSCEAVHAYIEPDTLQRRRHVEQLFLRASLSETSGEQGDAQTIRRNGASLPSDGARAPQPVPPVRAQL